MRRIQQLTPEQQEKGCEALGIGVGIAGAWTIGGLLLASGLVAPVAFAAGIWYLTHDTGEERAAPPNVENDRPHQPW